MGLSLSRWRRGAGYLGFLCFAGTCAAVYGCYQYRLPEIVRYQHAVLGMGIFLGLAMLSQFFGFSGKEGQIRDGLLDYMENRVSAVQTQPEPVQADEKEKSVLIDQVMQGVKQTAAAGTKFSGLLSRRGRTGNAGSYPGISDVTGKKAEVWLMIALQTEVDLLN